MVAVNEGAERKEKKNELKKLKNQRASSASFSVSGMYNVQGSEF